MDAPRWSQIRTIFFAAQDLDPAAREGYVRERTHGDPELEREVLRLLSLDEQAGTFLEAPAASGLPPWHDATEPLLTSGDIVCDRFKIIGLIGRGGMGEVYEAHDQVIDEIVAVKVVRSGDEPLATLAARWRREVLLARKVSHSGVCRVHDVATHRHTDGSELLLLTMERLRGETLADVTDGGSLSLDDALAIAEQIAGALDAAHAEGVLHRDVKPDNIFIERREGNTRRAVLTDFGLARLTSGGAIPRVTQTGLLAGTPGYLAPELLRGEPPSPRSDLYAFAVVVRELLATSAPTLPRAASDVMARALSHEPDARFGSARELMTALRAALRPAPARQPMRGAAVGLVALGIMIAIVSLYFVAMRLRIQKPPAASEVMLTDMLNATTDPELDGATEVLRSQLALSPKFDLLGADRVRAVLTLMGRPHLSPLAPEVAREVAMREGVPIVIYSTLSRLGQEYRLEVKLEQTGSRPSVVENTWTNVFSAQAKRDLFEAIHDAGAWIRERVGEVPGPRTDPPPSETTTSSWEALRYFAQGETLSREGQLNEATLMFERAIRLDPDFAMAHMRLADTLISLRRHKEGYAAWQDAIAAADRRQLTTRETHRIRAQYFDDTGDLEKAEKAYRTYATDYPDDYLAVFFLGYVLNDLNRTDAVLSLERAHQLRPTSVSASVHLVRVYLTLGRVANADAVTRGLESIGTPDASNWARWLRALTAFIGQDLQRALTQLEPLRASADSRWRSRTFTLRASWLSELGRDAEAVTELKAGIAFDDEQGLRDRMADKWLHLAALQVRARDPAGVESAARALEIASNASRIATAGNLFVEAGALTAANRLIPMLDDFANVRVTLTARQRLQGAVAVGNGQFAQAAEAYAQGLRNVRPRENRLPLVRALIGAGQRDEAERRLKAIVERPVAIYSGPEPQEPGLWRQAIVELATLIAQRSPGEADALRQRYAGVLQGIH